MATLWQDLTHALRGLRKHPGYATAAVLVLALGIAANAAVFTVVNALLFKPLPVPTPEAMAFVFNTARGELLTHEPMAFADYRDLRERSTSFAALAAYRLAPVALETGPESQMVIGTAVSADYFSTVEVAPTLGRGFAAADEAPGAPLVVVVSHAAWQLRFGGDPAILGRVLRVNGSPASVVGVAPPGFSGLQRGFAVEMWLPVRTLFGLSGRASDLERRDSRSLFVVGRLAPGATVAGADAEAAAIGAQLAAEFPDTNRDRNVAVLAAADVRILPGVDTVVTAASAVLLAVVALMLVIVAANVGNMVLARGIARRRELAVRRALGASRWRLVRLFLAESVVLSLVAAALALGLAAAFARALDALPLPLPIEIRLGAEVDLRVLAFTVVVALATACLFGMAPALAAGRGGEWSALAGEGRTVSAGRDRRRLRTLLVGAQVAVSAVLLAVAGLALRSLLNAGRIDPGFDPGGVATVTLAADLRNYSRNQTGALYRTLAERAAALPGVSSVAVATHLPLSFEIRTNQAWPDGVEAPDEKQWPEYDTCAVSHGYLATMGIPLVRGRDFAAAEAAGARPVIVNETMASRLWPGADPLGRRLRLDADELPWEVVGVARDSKYRTVGEDPRPFLYQPFSVVPEGAATVLVRTAGDPGALLAPLRALAREVDPLVPVLALRTLEEAASAALLLPRAAATVFGVVGLLGVAIAAVGLYGVLAFSVAQRTRELGVRQALGATPRRIVTMVLLQGLWPVGWGAAAGVLIALAATRVMGAILYGVSAADPATYAGVVAVLGLAALLACAVPALRAVRTDPAAALRCE